MDFNFFIPSKGSEDKVGFEQIDKHEPLANSDEGYDWLDELHYPPYSIYSCKR